MKTKIPAGSLLVLMAIMATMILARAEDNPAQAAARALLVQKLFDMTPPAAPPATPPPAPTPKPSSSVPAPTPPIVQPAVQPPPAPAAKWDSGVELSPTNLILAPAKPVPPAVTSVVAAKPVVTPIKPVTLAAPVVTPKPSPPPAAPPVAKPVSRMPTGVDLVTITGATYRAALISKVESDGLIISYVPAGGGIAMTKVYFDDLPAELRQQYVKSKPAAPEKPPAE